MAFDPSGMLVLEAPMDAAREELVGLVHEHRRWLKHRLAAVQADARCIPAPRYEAGELLQYLGEAYELNVASGPASVSRSEKDPQLRLFKDVRGIAGQISVRSPDPSASAIQRILKGWYADEARVLFSRSFARFQHLPWLKQWSGHWRARFMRSQWGSCSISGRIALNTHLVKVPEPLIDYVVLHELCHLEHHDHSHRFYALMRSHMSDWEGRRDQLNDYLPLLLHE
jgi:predicted metal-dependent hydrolase